jgi:hypothetical protein
MNGKYTVRKVLSYFENAPLAVIPGGNLLRIRLAWLITQKIPSGNDCGGRRCRNTHLWA